MPSPKRFHVNHQNEIRPCSAETEESCEFRNFSSYQEASSYREELLESQSEFPLVQKKKSSTDIYEGVEKIPHSMNLTSTTEEVIADLSEVGTPLIVGGSVRDSLYGSDSKDVDIEVFGANVESISSALRKRGYRVDSVGQQFGILKVAKNGEDFDISVPRRENRTGAKHTDFTVETDETMTVKDSIERRDFTINGILYDPTSSQIVDASGGREDLKNGVLRHISPKFAEDPLRVLRGFQMSSRFGLRASPETVKLCRDLRPEYESLSIERVRTEWEKFYTKSTDYEKGIRFLRSTGWDSTIPGLKESLAKSSVRDSLSRLGEVAKEKRAVFGAAIIGKSSSNPDSIYNSTLMSKSEARTAKTLASISATDVDSVKKRKYLALELNRSKTSFEDYRDLCTISGDSKGREAASSAIREGVGKEPEPDLILGRDLISLSDQKPGPWVKAAQTHLRDLQYEGKFSTREKALDYAKNFLKS